MKLFTIALSSLLAVSPAFAKAKPSAPTPKWLVSMPPLAFDYPYTGNLEVVRGNAGLMKEKCTAYKGEYGPVAIGCAISRRLEKDPPDAPAVFCIIYIAEDSILAKDRWSYADLLRHEMGHCNGWHGPEHAGKRPSTAKAGTPPAYLRTCTVNADRTGATCTSLVP